MLENPSTTPQGFILSLAELRRVLKRLSTPVRMWWVYRTHLKGNHPCVLIAYRQLDAMELATDISFSFPVEPLAGPDVPETSVSVYLHPETLEPDLVGLYLEPDGMKSDFIADFECFWPPLQQALERLETLQLRLLGRFVEVATQTH